MRLIKKFTSMARTEQILIMVSCLVLVGLSIFIFTYGNTWLNSDSAAAVTLANEQIKHNDIFPDAWHGSTGVMLLNFPIMFILNFTSDFLFAKSIAQMGFMLIMLASVVLFSRKVYKNNCWVLLIPVLFSFISSTQYEMLFIQCGYTASVFLLLFTISLFFDSVEQGAHIKKRLSFFVFLFCLFVACLLGIATIQQITIPLVGALVIIYVIDHANQKLCKLTNCKNFLIIILFIIFVSMIGLIISEKVLVEQMNLSGNPELMRFAASFSDMSRNISTLFQGYIHLIGIEPDVAIFSFAGIQNLLRIFFMTSLTIVFPFLACKNFKESSYSCKLFIVFSLIHILEVIIILIFSVGSDYIGSTRYLLLSVILLNIISCAYIYDRYLKQEKLISFIYSIAIAGFAIIISISTFNFSGYQDAIFRMKGLTNYLEENGLHYGYASFWNAGNNTVLSNGKVQINAVNFFEDHVEEYLWLSSEEWYDPKSYEGNTFFMMSKEELESFAPDGVEKTWLGMPEKILQYDGFVILVFDYNIAENNFGGDLSRNSSLLSHMVCSDDRSMRLQNDHVEIKDGQVLYGPYIDLDPGKYLLTVEAEFKEPVSFNVTSGAGSNILDSFELTQDQNTFILNISAAAEKVEIPIYGMEGQSIIISSIQLVKQS